MAKPKKAELAACLADLIEVLGLEDVSAEGTVKELTESITAAASQLSEHEVSDETVATLEALGLVEPPAPAPAAEKPPEPEPEPEIVFEDKVIFDGECNVMSVNALGNLVRMVAQTPEGHKGATIETPKNVHVVVTVSVPVIEQTEAEDGSDG